MSDVEILTQKVKQLEDENRQLKSEVGSLTEAQIALQGDKVFEHAQKKLLFIITPYMVIFGALGFVGFDYLKSRIELALITPKIDEIIKASVDDRVTEVMDAIVEKRINQETTIHAKQTVNISSEYWVITGSSILVSDIVSERERVLRKLTSSGIDYTQKYSDLVILSSKNNGSERIIYSLALGPYTSENIADQRLELAKRDGFRTDSYVKQLSTAEVIKGLK